MLKYVLTRILRTVPRLFLITILAFILIELPPGDVVQFHFDRLRNGGVPMSEEAEEAYRRTYGLDRPIHVRYGIWMCNILFRFDFGYAFMYAATVALFGRIPRRDGPRPAHSQSNTGDRLFQPGYVPGSQLYPDHRLPHLHEQPAL